MRLLGAILLTAVMAVLLLVPSCGRARHSCSVCGGEECANLTFRIRLADSEVVETCCARCGVHFLKTERRPVASLEVRDFDTAQPLDARSAIYVVGSDVTPCKDMHATSAPRDERGCCLRPTYDRCLPSVLAFQARERAVEFSTQHGGSLASFDQL